VLAAIGFDGVGQRRVDDPRWLSVGLDAVGASASKSGAATVRSLGPRRERPLEPRRRLRLLAIEVEESADDDFRRGEAAYREIVAFMHKSATPHVLRL